LPILSCLNVVMGWSKVMYAAIWGQALWWCRTRLFQHLCVFNTQLMQCLRSQLLIEYADPSWCPALGCICDRNLYDLLNRNWTAWMGPSWMLVPPLCKFCMHNCLCLYDTGFLSCNNVLL
jgi:hypothetical protein